MQLKQLSQIPLEQVSHHEQIFKQVLLRYEEIPHVTNFAQATLIAGQRVEEHAHQDMFEVFYILSGRGQATINSQTIDLTQGVCLVIEPGDTHSFNCDDSEGLQMLYFGTLA